MKPIVGHSRVQKGIRVLYKPIWYHSHKIFIIGICKDEMCFGSSLNNVLMNIFYIFFFLPHSILITSNIVIKKFKEGCISNYNNSFFFHIGYLSFDHNRKINIIALVSYSQQLAIN